MNLCFQFAVYTFCLNSLLCEEIDLYPPSQTSTDPYYVSQAGEHKSIKFKVSFRESAKPLSFEKQRKQYMENYIVMCELSDYENCGKPTTERCYCEQKIDDNIYIVAYNLTLNSSDSEAHIKAIFTYYNGPVITSPEVTLPKIVERGRQSTCEVCTCRDKVITLGCVLGILLIVFIILFIIYFWHSKSLKREVGNLTKKLATQDKAKDKECSHILDGNQDEKQLALSNLRPSGEDIDVRANKSLLRTVK